MEKKERKPLRVAVYCRFARADEKNTMLKVQRKTPHLCKRAGI